MKFQLNIYQRYSEFTNLIIKYLGIAVSLLVWIAIGSIFGYIAYKGSFAVIEYGFKNIFFTNEFSTTQKKASFWAPFGVTVFLCFLVTILVIPIALRCAVWICFECNKKWQKIISSLLLVISNIPSIVIGIFIRKYFAYPIKKIFGLNNTLNLVTASFALAWMILPLIIALFTSVLKRQKQFITSSEVLGLSRNYSIYKIVLKKIKITVFTSIIMISGRVLSESIMLSTLLSGENYKAGYKNIQSFINSQINSISPLISDNFYSDGADTNVQNLMFLFGALLIFSSIVFNSFCLHMGKYERNKFNSRLNIWNRISNLIYWKILNWSINLPKFLEEGKISLNEYIYKYKTLGINKGLRYIRRFFEYLSLAFLSVFVVGIISSIVIEGIIALSTNKQSNSLDDSIWRTIVNTLLIVVLSISTMAPVAFVMSIYLSEYSNENGFKKATLSLINACNSTPSIMFGIFGFSVFIKTFKLSNMGNKSLLAGALTISLLILPYLTQLFYSHISSVNKKYREASYVLGIGKWKTFWKVVLPAVSTHLSFSVLLSIGKIIGETAPLYLTAGMNNISQTSLMYQGQTLTTRIFAQLYESNLEVGKKITNETAFISLIFASILVFTGKYCLEKWKEIRWKINTLFYSLRNAF